MWDFYLAYSRGRVRHRLPRRLPASWAVGRPEMRPYPNIAAHARGTAHPVRAGAGLPVRLRAWDGSEAGPADGPVVVIRSRRALRRLLWSPGRARPRPARTSAAISTSRATSPTASGGCGEFAREHGPGSATCATSRRARRRGPPRCDRSAAAPADAEAQVAGRLHSRAPRPGRHRAPLRPVERLLRAAPRRDHGVLVRVLDLDAPDYTLADAQRDKLDLDLPQARPASRPCGCSTSAAAGDR